MSSRTAAWGQPPVSTATMRSLYSCQTCSPVMCVLWLLLRGQGIVLSKELTVFSGEDVVCYRGYGEACSEVFAEG